MKLAYLEVEWEGKRGRYDGRGRKGEEETEGRERTKLRKNIG